MLGLNTALSIATEALGAQTAGLQVANNNIANVNTPGYARQVVSLASAASLQNGSSVDEGVSYEGFTSVRDAVLSLAINATTSKQSSLEVQSALLSQVSSAFSGTTTGIGASISTLFSDLSALSTNPSDTAVRQTVLNDANQLANDFHNGATAFSNAVSAANQQVSGTVSQINQLTQQIAALNAQISSGGSTGEGGGALEDQRASLSNQLAQLVGFNSVQTESTPMLSTSNGSPLVIGDKSYPLQVAADSGGVLRVFDAQGNDITHGISGGALGGALTARDSALPALSEQLDSMASQFATAMNNAQAAGFDLSAGPGVAMFNVPATSSAASGISVALTDGSQIAVSADGSRNSSGNLQAFASVQSGTSMASGAPSQQYASVVENIGAAASQVSNQLTGTSAALQQLTSRQTSEAGVSIDEETTNLMRYQQAYEAAARVISTINDIYTTLMNISL